MIDKKVLALLAVAALAVTLALAGCGGSQASSASSVSEASSDAAAESTAAAEASAEASAAAEAAAPAAAQSSTSDIGPDAAKAAALEHAGIAEADCTEMKVDLDADDAIPHYDVEFTAGGMEYDYDIDPATGNILKSDSEIDD